MLTTHFVVYYRSAEIRGFDKSQEQEFTTETPRHGEESQADDLVFSSVSRCLGVSEVILASCHSAGAQILSNIGYAR
jgi:hypothetical protein